MKYSKLLHKVETFVKWAERYRKLELQRLTEYIMDLDAEGVSPPPEIMRIWDKGQDITKEEEDILIAWSESNTPGYYQIY